MLQRWAPDAGAIVLGRLIFFFVVFMSEKKLNLKINHNEENKLEEPCRP
jgi:hypothetical protein